MPREVLVRSSAWQTSLATNQIAPLASRKERRGVPCQSKRATGRLASAVVVSGVAAGLMVMFVIGSACVVPLVVHVPPAVHP